LPICAGCIAPYCAFPTLDYIPPIEVGPEPSAVYAFRVDITHEWIDTELLYGEGHDIKSISSVCLEPTQKVPALVKPSLSYGIAYNCIALIFGTYTNHSLAIRLYAPGYYLVEIPTWKWPAKIAWKKADTLRKQQYALEALLEGIKCDDSDGQHQVRLFVAKEYERLAIVADTADPKDQALRREFQNEAQRLREKITKKDESDEKEESD
jgi:hypothetical protein